MQVSPGEAEEALVAIQRMEQKTRHAIASSGTYITLIVTGIVWLIGFSGCRYNIQGVTRAYFVDFSTATAHWLSRPAR